MEKYAHSNTSDNCVHRYNVEILNLFDPELQLINTKLMIKLEEMKKPKELLSKLKKFKIQIILIFGYKRNDLKIFHSLIVSDSDIDETFKSMHQSIMAKINNYACKDWIVLDVTIKHSIKIFEC